MRTSSYILSGVIAVIMLICCILAAFGEAPYNGDFSEDMTDFSEGWTYGDGETADLRHLRAEKSFVLLHEFDLGSDTVNLCFMSKNINFTVCLDDEPLYDFRPDVSRIFGFAYGKFVHNIRLPSASDAKYIKIITEPAYGDGSERFEDIRLDRASEYDEWMLSRGFAQFIVCILVAFLGAVLIVAGLIYSIKVEERLQTISLGLLAVLSGIWEGSEQIVMQMLTGHSAAVHFANYLCLIFIPLPAAYLIASLTRFTKSKVIILVEALVFTNLAVQLFCTIAGIRDYHGLLTCSHIVIVFTVAACVGLLIRSVIHKSFERRKRITVILGFSALAISGIIEILLYRANVSHGTVFMIGILIFVVYLGQYEIHELLVISEQNSNARAMFNLAHTDGLTGLENRLAFGEYEEHISKKESGAYTIAQFDINDLKKVNDEYGHSAGDTHINAGAGIIKATFGASGHIFRTGGDEFIAILEAGSCTDAKMKEFEQRISAYNFANQPPVPLAIAVGSAEYTCGDDIAKAEIRADELMYSDKKRKKMSTR